MKKAIQHLYRATPGSPGLDLSFFTFTVLTPEMGIQALSAGVYEYCLADVRKKQYSMLGIMVAPGIIDAYYKRDINVMTYSPGGISIINSGQKLAQLILLQEVQKNNVCKMEEGKYDLTHQMFIVS